MAASVYWLKFPCRPRPMASFRGQLFLHTGLVLFAAALIFLCISSTSRLMIYLHQNNDNHLAVNDATTKQMIQIWLPEPTKSSVLELSNASAKGDHEATDAMDEDTTEGTQNQLLTIEEDDDAPDTSVDYRREDAESQLTEQSLAAPIVEVDDEATDTLDDRREDSNQNQLPEESPVVEEDDDAPNTSVDNRREDAESQLPEQSLAAPIVEEDDDAPDTLVENRREDTESQLSEQSLAVPIVEEDDDAPNTSVDNRREDAESQLPEQSLAAPIVEVDDEATDTLDDSWEDSDQDQLTEESLVVEEEDDAPDTSVDSRREDVESQLPEQSLAAPIVRVDDEATDTLDDRREDSDQNQLPEESPVVEDEAHDASDPRREGTENQLPEESPPARIDDEAPNALDDRKEGVRSKEIPEESLAGAIVEVVEEAHDAFDNRREGTQSQSSEESSDSSVVEVEDEAPDALDNRREGTQSELPEKSRAAPIGNSVDNDNEVYHDNDLFFENYKKMNESLKIYVYPHSPDDRFANVLLPVTSEPGGNYASESYFKKALMKSHFITKDPSEADFFFLPFSITGMRNDKRIGVGGMQDYVQDYVSNVRQKYPYWNRTGGADHFYVACHSIGKIAMGKAEEVKNNAIQVVCSSNYFVNGYVAHKDVSLPQIWPRHGNPPRVEPSKRKRLAFFAGACNSRPRQYLVKTWQNDSEIFAHSRRLKTPYEIEFLRSKFCFHVKGFEVNTARIGDAMYYGCVPVILADHYDLPFGDILNWKSFSVVVETGDIPLMKSILKGIGDEEYLRMHKNVEKVRKHFQWHGEPIEYDCFHIVMYELWLRRNYVRVPLS